MKKSTVLINSRRSFIALILLTFLWSSCKKEKFDSGTIKEFTLKSNVNGATYNIQVGLPYNYNPNAEKYGTVYVLDGKIIFGYVANRCKEISDNYGVNNVLVINIGYGNSRSIDYTPTKVSSVTGGAPQFLKFIETQLIPKIEQDFNADTSRAGRVILGHSYGGLFSVYAFSVNNKVFGNYLMLSPSFWFDNEVVLQMEKENRANNKNSKQLIFMGIGENEESDRMLAPFESFYQSLHNNYPNTKLEKNIEIKEDHIGSRHPNIIKGLNFYFQNR